MKVEHVTTAYIKQRCFQSSTYFSHMNASDLHARKYGQDTNLIDLYVENVYPITQTQLQKLNPIIEIANSKLSIFKKIHNIPWKLAVFNATVIENGFPHTRMDVIFLPDTLFNSPSSLPDNIVETLIHEKIHVYQRIYPVETNHLICNVKGMTIYTLKYKLDNDTKNRMRSNPDINRLIYKDLDQEPIMSLYNNKTPSSLVDIKDKRDHPFEMMAYYLSFKIYRNSIDSIPTEIREWMDTFL